MHFGDIPYFFWCKVFIGRTEIIYPLHVPDDVVLKGDDVHHFRRVADHRVHTLERTEKITVQVEVSVGDVFNRGPTFLHNVIALLEVIEIDL